jgi:hypothetical protein
MSYAKVSYNFIGQLISFKMPIQYDTVYKIVQSSSRESDFELEHSYL